MSAEVPVVFARWERFVAWLFDRTEKFPKRVAFTFRMRIDNLALDVFERLVEARYQRDREPTLRRVNLDIEKLRLLLRALKPRRHRPAPASCWFRQPPIMRPLSHEQKILDDKAFEHACGELAVERRWERSCKPFSAQPEASGTCPR